MKSICWGFIQLLIISSTLAQTPSSTTTNRVITRPAPPTTSTTTPTTTTTTTRTTTTTSLRPIDIKCMSYMSALPNNTLGWYSTGTPNVVPTPAFIQCPPLGCFVYCASDDETGECIRVARSEEATCTDQKSAYSCSTSSYYSASVSGSFTVTTTLYITNTITSVSYPTTIPSNRTFTFDTSRGTRRIITPVYVYGNPITSTSVTTSLYGTLTLTTASSYLSGLYTESPPYCSIIVAGITTCAYCSIVAPTPAQVYYWPESVANPSSTVIDGIDMTSPSVYIRFPTLLGQDSCTRTRGVEQNVVISLAPTDFSSVFSSAGIYGTLSSSVFNFADIGPPINVDAYERQPSCVAGQGCATIYPYYAPPISIPASLANLNPTWVASSCTLSRFGFSEYPPIAIQPVRSTPAAEPPVTTSATAAATTLVTSLLGASPCSTPSPQTPAATSTGT